MLIRGVRIGPQKPSTQKKLERRLRRRIIDFSPQMFKSRDTRPRRRHYAHTAVTTQYRHLIYYYCIYNCCRCRRSTWQRQRLQKKKKKKEEEETIHRLSSGERLRRYITTQCAYKVIIPHITTVVVSRGDVEDLSPRTCIYIYIICIASTWGSVLAVVSKCQPAQSKVISLIPPDLPFKRICMLFPFPLLYRLLLRSPLFNLTNGVFSGNTSRIPSNVIRK